LPFDPSIGVADPNDAAALLGVTLYTDTAVADPNDTAAGRTGIPKDTIAVSRILTENSRDRWTARGVRRRRISRNLYG